MHGLRCLLPIVMLLIALFPRTGQTETFVMMTGEWPPHITNNLPDQGSHTKRLRLALQRAGHDLDARFVPWKRAWKAVATGQAIGSYSWTKTPDRQKEVRFASQPIGSLHQQAWFKKGTLPEEIELNSLEELIDRKLRMAGVISYWYEKRLRKSDGNTYFVNSSEEMWKMIDGGRVDVVISSIPVAQDEIPLYLGEDRLNLYTHSHGSLRTAFLYPVFTRNNPAALRALMAYDAHINDIHVN